MPQTKTTESIAVMYNSRHLPAGITRSIERILSGRSDPNANDPTERLQTAAWRAVHTADHRSIAEALIDVYRAEAETVDAASAAPLWVEIARLYEDVLKDTPSAAAAARQALQLDDNADGARRLLFRLATQAGKRISSQELPALRQKNGNGQTNVNTLLDLALFEEVQLNNHDHAIAHYKAVLQHSPQNLEAQEALQRLYVQREDWPALCESLQLAADQETDPEMRGLLNLAAALAGDHLPPNERAKLAAQAVQHNDHSAVALPVAISLYLRAEEPTAALELLKTKSDRDPQNAAVQFQTSWLLAQIDNHTDDAIHYAERAVEQSPNELLYAVWLQQLLRQARRWPELAEHLTAYRDHGDDYQTQISFGIALAQVQMYPLRDPAAAIKTLEALMQTRPNERRLSGAAGAPIHPATALGRPGHDAPGRG